MTSEIKLRKVRLTSETPDLDKRVAGRSPEMLLQVNPMDNVEVSSRSEYGQDSSKASNRKHS